MSAWEPFRLTASVSLCVFPPSTSRYMLGLSVIPAVLQFLGFLFLPESPRWLIQCGLTQKARRVLSQIRGNQNIDEEYDSIKNSIEEEEKDSSGGEQKPGTGGGKLQVGRKTKRNTFVPGLMHVESLVYFRSSSTQSVSEVLPSFFGFHHIPNSFQKVSLKWLIDCLMHINTLQTFILKLDVVTKPTGCFGICFF